MCANGGTAVRHVSGHWCLCRATSRVHVLGRERGEQPRTQSSLSAVSSAATNKACQQTSWHARRTAQAEPQHTQFTAITHTEHCDSHRSTFTVARRLVTRRARRADQPLWPQAARARQPTPIRSQHDTWPSQLTTQATLLLTTCTDRRPRPVNMAGENAPCRAPPGLLHAHRAAAPPRTRREAAAAIISRGPVRFLGRGSCYRGSWRRRPTRRRGA